MKNKIKMRKYGGRKSTILDAEESPGEAM